MKPKRRTTTKGEVWMQVRDPKKLQRLMVIQEVTQQELAAAAQWSSHSIVGRILRGEVTTVTPERAARIAHHLQVAVDDLFMTRVSTPTGQPARRGRTAA